MKLFYSPTSPFVRKVMVTAMAAGLEPQIERVTTNPWESPPDLLAQNPLSKVPCLITEDGLSLFDSPVICDYLIEQGEIAILKATGASRWLQLKQQALADGIMDAAVIRRNESARPDEEARRTNMERQRQAMANGLDALERVPPASHLDIGTISIACCLGYLDLRFAHEPWHETHPKLAEWFAAFSQRPEMTATAPA
ncbi:MAG: glutathione S-transferase N-terminal domain-containing protein [Acetobacteraceae bacterium]|nr:glutathione S-transferase N-terminal domain-containing protein [Acetobacteraceae bacterium]